MLEFIKKSLAFGMGAAILTADKIRQFADEAVARGEMSADEAKKFVDDVSKRAEEERGNMQNWIREQVARMVKDAGCADAKDVHALEKRVKAIETRLAVLETAVVESQEIT